MSLLTLQQQTMAEVQETNFNMNNPQDNINKLSVTGYPNNFFYQNTLPVRREITWDTVRLKRNSLLNSTDWAALPDATPKPSQQDWIDYRQTLRDITENFSSPEEVTWPKKPE